MLAALIIERMHPIFLIPIALTVLLIWSAVKVMRERLRERDKPRPIYYVQHPDGSFTRADPQP